MCTEQNNTIQKIKLHKRYNTKHTDRTVTTLYDSRGGGGGREKADICVAEETNCNESGFEFEMC